jgi:hypothetical protein
VSRASVIGMLVAAELLIVGIAIYAVRAGSGPAGRAWSGAPGRLAGRAMTPLAAGPAPVVTIDDPGSRVEVTASNDGLIHVTDRSRAQGFPFGARLGPLRVIRTPGGVRIERPASGMPQFEWGFFEERVAVAVPPASRIEILHCSGADVSGVAGGTAIHSDDGHISLTRLKGYIEASSDDGAVDVTDTEADALSLRSDDGHIALRGVRAARLAARTSDGSIRVHDLALTGTASSTLSTGDGSVELALAPGANLTVEASTDDGSITVDGTRYSGDDSIRRSIRLGNGAAILTLSTADGSIHIITNGAL